MEALGEGFARALARKDVTALRELLRPDVDFRAMTPGRFWEGTDAAAIIDDILLGTWFKPSDEIKELLSVETSAVGSRARVGYRLHVERAGEPYLVEQQAYYEPDRDRIGWLRIMCAGYQAVP